MKNLKREKAASLVLLFLFAIPMFAVAVACGATEPTPTPMLPAQPGQPAAPTVVAQPTATLAPGAPTAIPARPSPTRVLPTATPVAPDAAEYGGTLRVAYPAGVFTLDPHLDTATYGRPVTYVLFNTIVAYDTDLNIVPELAESWEFSDDGTTVTFHLVPGIKFQDGTPLDAAAVKWSLERVMNPEASIPYRSALEPFVERVEVVDDTTFAIHLAEPFRPLLATLGERPGFIVPKSKAPLQAEGQQGSLVTSGFSGSPVGSGAFKFRKWLPGNQIVVERWEEYWEEGKPYLDEVVFQEVTEYSSRLAMLRTGETDLTDIRAEDLSLVERNANVKIVPHESGRWMGLVLAVDVPPWDNKALRQAFAYSINREVIIETYLGGQGRPAFSSEGIGWAYNPDIRPITYDPQKAREKLAEAGYPSGITLDFSCASDNVSLQLCEIYQSMAGDVGITLNVKPIPGGDRAQKILAREITEFAPATMRPRADPDGRLRVLYYTGGGLQALDGYSNPEVDRLIDEAAKIYDTSEAKRLYDEIQRTLSDDVASIYVAYTNDYAGLNSRVNNFAWIPDFQWRIRDLWVSR